MSNSLVRSSSDKVIAGVCGGLARQFGIDSNLLRVLFVLGAIFLQFGWLIYVALWLLLPAESSGRTGFDALKDQFGSSSN
ncbi:PspC domain-containing protein [Propioniciclava sinopodophylli]|uniref:PspC domain-containing protein n=1 Tax=Propioniciclava sinopodophylli TaxID=1837344 RepID=UPI002493A06F|nr:PspC domain-containing protein [Propioniciclava sinopodophylli]